MVSQDRPFEVLVVEDDPTTFDVLDRVRHQQFSEARFINVATAQETIEYLEKKAVRPPHLILLDIDLHQAMDGLDLLTELHQRLRGRVPIIMLTISDSQEHIQQAYRKGATAYTQKPDELQGWKEYIRLLKAYWYQTTILPLSLS